MVDPKKPFAVLSNVNAIDGLDACANLLTWMLTIMAAKDGSDSSGEFPLIEMFKRNVMNASMLSPDAKNFAFTVIECAEISAREACSGDGKKMENGNGD